MDDKEDKKRQFSVFGAISRAFNAQAKKLSDPEKSNLSPEAKLAEEKRHLEFLEWSVVSSRILDRMRFGSKSETESELTRASKKALEKLKSSLPKTPKGSGQG